MIEISKAKHIAVMRASAVGDFIFVLPFLQTLRAAAPGAKITYIGTSWHKDFGEGRIDSVDEFVVTEQFNDDYDASIEATFPSPLDDATYDVLFQFHDDSEYANAVASRIKSNYRLGFAHNGVSSYLDYALPLPFYMSEYTRYLEFLRYLGINTFEVYPRIPVLPKDYDELKAVMGNDYVTDSGPKIAVIHPGAGNIRRRWKPGRFAKVADYLADNDYGVVLTGSRQDLEIVSKVARHMKREVKSVAGLMSVGGLAALFKQTAIVVTNDTGPLHLARFVGAHTVGLYAHPYSQHAAPILTAYDRTLISPQVRCGHCDALLLQHEWDAPPQVTSNTSKMCKHEYSMLSDITVEAVLRAIESLNL